MLKTIRLLMLLLAVGAVGVIAGRSIAPPPAPVTREQVEAEVGLDHVVADVNFNETPLDDAVKILRQKTGTNLVVKWHELEKAGLDRNTPLTLRLTNLSLKRVLELLCDTAGGGTVELNARGADGAIVLSTAEDHSRHAALRLYDIRDLMQAHHDFRVKHGWKPPEAAVNVGGGKSLFTAPAAAAAANMPSPYFDAINEITHLIQDQVAPAEWRDAGGTTGSIREFNGRLLITATPEMHDEIVALLALLRKEK